MRLLSIALCLASISAFGEPDDGREELLKHLNLDPGGEFIYEVPDPQEVDSDLPLLEREAYMNCVIHERGNGPKLIFAGISSDFSYTDPYIFIEENGSWRSIALPYQKHHFVYAARTADGDRAYAIVENTPEGPGHELPLFMSDDGGRTWKQIASIKKPYWMGYFHDFTMDKDGRGALTIELETEVITGLALRGLFTTTTKDWGKTWSKFNVEWDSLSSGGETYVGSHSEQEKVRKILGLHHSKP